MRSIMRMQTEICTLPKLVTGLQNNLISHTPWDALLQPRIYPDGCGAGQYCWLSRSETACLVEDIPYLLLYVQGPSM